VAKYSHMYKARNGACPSNEDLAAAIQGATKTCLPLLLSQNEGFLTACAVDNSDTAMGCRPILEDFETGRRAGAYQGCGKI
jgi:hypothetical protein